MNLFRRFVRSVLRPTEETTRIPVSLDKAIQRQQKAATAAYKAVEDLLDFMESAHGGHASRPPKK